MRSLDPSRFGRYVMDSSDARSSVGGLSKCRSVAWVDSYWVMNGHQLIDYYIDRGDSFVIPT